MNAIPFNLALEGCVSVKVLLLLVTVLVLVTVTVLVVGTVVVTSGLDITSTQGSRSSAANP